MALFTNFLEMCIFEGIPDLLLTDRRHIFKKYGNFLKIMSEKISKVTVLTGENAYFRDFFTFLKGCHRVVIVSGNNIFDIYSKINLKYI